MDRRDSSIAVARRLSNPGPAVRVARFEGISFPLAGAEKAAAPWEAVREIVRLVAEVQDLVEAVDQDDQVERGGRRECPRHRLLKMNQWRPLRQIDKGFEVDGR